MSIIRHHESLTQNVFTVNEIFCQFVFSGTENKFNEITWDKKRFRTGEITENNLYNSKVKRLASMNYHFNPYSKNIVFFDTEFTSLNPYLGEILSIGLVKLDGSELYLELEYGGEIDPWVKKNIIPTLKNQKVSREKTVKQIKKFIGKKKPYAVSYVNQYDTLYVYKLFTRKLFNDGKHPFFWLPIDFASILFSLGIDPEAYFSTDKKNFFKEIGIDASKYKAHNALDDAKLLREVYLKMVK